MRARRVASSQPKPRRLSLSQLFNKPAYALWQWSGSNIAPLLAQSLANELESIMMEVHLVPVVFLTGAMHKALAGSAH
jgi:hypothetical protein